MKITKREAIRECKRLWRFVLEGKARNKKEALSLYPQARKYWYGCPFCDYSTDLKCQTCPLVEQTGWKCENRRINYRFYPELFASVIMALKE